MNATPLAPLSDAPTVLSIRVDTTSYDRASEQIGHWIETGGGRYVCIANVHMVMEAHDDSGFQAIVNAGDLITPDGMPLVWCLRRLGFPDQGRVAGPDLMLRLLELATRQGWRVGLYGGDQETMDALQTRIRADWPDLDLPYAYSPPFRPLSEEEDQAVCDRINDTGVQLLFVGLGCPKQERWMAEHRDRLNCVMIGVGAAFVIHAGLRTQAPEVVRQAGFEWAYRFIQEPRRLWKRYLRHNPRFVAFALAPLYLRPSSRASKRTP